MEMREVLRAAAGLTIRPARPESERARRSGVVVTPHRGGEVLVEPFTQAGQGARIGA
jgi:hypothetical protein